METPKWIDMIKKVGGDYVIVLSEPAFDAAYFNPLAWKNLLKFLKKSPWITGILLDGPWTRLDRPEILDTLMTYWDLKSEEECKEASERVPNWEQVQSMQRTQFEILGHRLAELRAAAPDAEIVLSIYCDDTHHSVSAELHELLISRQVKIESSIDSLKGKRSMLIAKAKELNKVSRDVAKQLRKRTKSVNAKPAAQQKLNKLTANLAMVGTNIREINQKIGGLTDEAGLFREKKTRPTHQFVTADVVRMVEASVRAICDVNKVKFTSKPGVLVFGDLVIDYSHSRNERSWAPMRDAGDKLVSHVHGKKESLHQAYADALRELGKTAMETGSVDVVLNSGHDGVGFKQFQLIEVDEDAANFKDESKYGTGRITGTHVTLVCAIPFEDQEKIGDFKKGKEPVRMSLGKPMGTRKHAAFDRDSNDSVSGVTIIGKFPGAPTGMVMTRFIEYDRVLNGTVLNQPDEYVGVTLSGDEHIGSRESRPAVRRGLSLLHSQYLGEKFSFCGRPAILKGSLNVGDTGEANSRKWTFRGYDERDPDDVMNENIDGGTELNPEDPDSVLAHATKCTNDSMGGSVESMRVVKRFVRRYLYGFLGETLKHSTLRVAQATIPGNHADDVLRDMGEKETDFLSEWCEAKGIGIYEVGQSNHYSSATGRDPRLWLGGFSCARVLRIDDYGLDVNGKPLFGPLRIVMQHDPKKMGKSDGVVGAARTNGAHAAYAGHTHENRVLLFRRGRNKIGLAYRCAAMQGHGPVSALLAGSVSRTVGAHFIFMCPGDFADMTFSGDYLERICEEELRGRALARIKARKERKSGKGVA